MFTDTPTSRPQRRGLALLLSLGVNTLLVGSLFLVQPPSAPAADPVVAPEYAPVFITPALAPSKPAPAAGRARTGTAPRSPPPSPAEAVPVVPTVLALPTDSQADTALVADAGPAGPATGPPGDGLGLGKGPGTGEEAGGGSGPRTVHWSEVQVRSQARPTYPRAAEALGFTTPQDCVVRLEIDTAGVPVAARVRRCNPVFAGVAVEAALAWRFYPLVQDGAPIASQFDLNFRFRPQ